MITECINGLMGRRRTDIYATPFQKYWLITGFTKIKYRTSEMLIIQPLIIKLTGQSKTAMSLLNISDWPKTAPDTIAQLKKRNCCAKATELSLLKYIQKTCTLKTCLTENYLN